MIERKQLQKIMVEYRRLFERYEPGISTLSIDEIKRLIGEVRLFWHRHNKYINYFLSNITKEDEVSYLAGAVRLDIRNNGHLEFLICGKLRLINEPILKMSGLYAASDDDINLNNINAYFIECICDLLKMLDEFGDDFYVFPIEPFQYSETEQYYDVLNDLSKNLSLSLFNKDYSSMEEALEQLDSYESIERQLKDEVKENIVFESIKDSQLSLREKCEKYISANREYLPFLSNLTESRVFFIAINQYFMQTLGIVNCAINSNLIPFIRDDITFNYFSLIIGSAKIEDFSREEYLKTYISYILQKYIDFSKIGYKNTKEYLGNCTLIHYIDSQITHKEKEFPKPSEILKLAESYIECNCKA